MKDKTGNCHYAIFISAILAMYVAMPFPFPMALRHFGLLCFLFVRFRLYFLFCWIFSSRILTWFVKRVTEAWRVWMVYGLVSYYSFHMTPP